MLEQPPSFLPKQRLIMGHLNAKNHLLPAKAFLIVSYVITATPPNLGVGD